MTNASSAGATEVIMALVRGRDLQDKKLLPTTVAIILPWYIHSFL